jgi:Zn finger protein HypA/HybF involved in hydrogenase expression
VADALRITQGLIDSALASAAEAGGGRVAHAHIVLGELLGVDEDEVRLFWAALAAGTPAAGAALTFDGEPALAGCPDCNHAFEVGPEQAPELYPGSPLVCPRCEGRKARLLSGGEAYVESIRIDRAADG